MFTKLFFSSAFVFFCSALTFAQNVGINETGAAPENSAILDVSSPDKGVLVPRVALTSATDAVTIASPAVSLLIYNTATAGVIPNMVSPGYYYWDGTIWVRLQDNEANHYAIDDVQSVVATTNVDATVGPSSTTNNVSIGLSITVTIPANKEGLVYVSYSVPMGSYLSGELEGYFGIRFLKNGVEEQAGSRKVTIPTRFPGAGGVLMSTISGTFTDIIPASPTPQTITYTLNGYIENLDPLEDSSVRFNMWSPFGNNFNWGRGSLTSTTYVR